MTDTTPMAVKFVDGSDTAIEGLAIPFGGPFGGKDFHGEDFGPDTDLVPDLYPAGRPIIYHHGVNKDAGVIVQGRQTEHVARDEGIWAKGELDKSARYHATVARMIAQGKMFFSSGAIPHLVKTDSAGHITRWPWMELSLTPTPANPDARVYAVKSGDLIDHLEAADIDVPPALKLFLDRDDGPESEPFASQADRLSVALDAFASRAELRRDWRAKAGRALSASNRSDIADLVEAIRPIAETWQKLTDLLARTDPVAADAAKDAEQEHLAWLHKQTRQATEVRRMA